MSSVPAPPPPVCDDADEARSRLAEGLDVVLIVAERSAAGSDLSGASGTGRLALFVGDRADPAVVDAAGAMAVELFGTRPPDAGVAQP